MPMRTQILKLGDATESSAGPAPSAAPPAEQAEATAAPPKPAAESRDQPKVEAESTRIAANLAAEPPKAAPAASVPKPQAAVDGDWTVQVGSFEDEANARRLAQRVATFGHKAEVSSYKSGARTLYRVRVGPQATKAAADAAASALRAHGVEARVVAAR
jgi:DedD protein